MNAAVLAFPITPRRRRRGNQPIPPAMAGMPGITEDRLAHAGIAFEAQVLSYHVRDMEAQLNKLRQLIDDTFPV